MSVEVIKMDDIQKVRFMVGDTDLDNEWFPDETYQFLLKENSGDTTKAAIEALEALINQIALSPNHVRIGDVEEWGVSVETLERRLIALKLKGSKRKGVPIVMRSDRQNWDDVNSIFHPCKLKDK